MPGLVMLRAEALALESAADIPINKTDNDFKVFFIVLLFCCFVVLAHSKTTPLSYPFSIPNQTKSWLFV
jgi:hypothetical protein